MYLPFLHELLHFFRGCTFMPSKLVFHVLVPEGFQIYWQESMQDQDPFVQEANAGDVGRSCHAGARGEVNSIYTGNNKHLPKKKKRNKKLPTKTLSTEYYPTSLFVPEMVLFFWFGNYVRGAYAAPGGRAMYRKAGN